MEVIGIGVDVVEISRIKDLISKWGEKFLSRIYTESEIKYCSKRRRKFEHFAGRFAAKEAVFKALGRRVSWQKIETLHGKNGAPNTEVALDNNCRFDSYVKVLISISHTKNNAMAFVILTEKQR